MVKTEKGKHKNSIPVFHDLVKRSTRFSTHVPASEMLVKIEEIIKKDEYPLPHPHKHVRQLAIVNHSGYKIEVTRGGILVATVQMFQQDTGLYMVEFLRGQMGIFQFKRFYEDIRSKLTQIIKGDYSYSRLFDAATVISKGENRGWLPSNMKRTKSNDL